MEMPGPTCQERLAAGEVLSLSDLDQYAVPPDPTAIKNTLHQLLPGFDDVAMRLWEWGQAGQPLPDAEYTTMQDLAQQFIGEQGQFHATIDSPAAQTLVTIGVRRCLLEYNKRSVYLAALANMRTPQQLIVAPEICSSVLESTYDLKPIRPPAIAQRRFAEQITRTMEQISHDYDSPTDVMELTDILRHCLSNSRSTSLYSDMINNFLSLPANPALTQIALNLWRDDVFTTGRLGRQLTRSYASDVPETVTVAEQALIDLGDVDGLTVSRSNPEDVLAVALAAIKTTLRSLAPPQLLARLQLEERMGDKSPALSYFFQTTNQLGPVLNRLGAAYDLPLPQLVGQPVELATAFFYIVEALRLNHNQSLTPADEAACQRVMRLVDGCCRLLRQLQPATVR